MNSLLQDCRFAFRTLARSPLFTLVALASLALGIGVNISIFGFINAALFKPLAVDRPAQLASIYHTNDAGSTEFYSSSYPEFEFYRDHNTAFSGMLAYLRIPMIVAAGGDSQQVSGELVSPEYFNVLGIRPAAGRLFGPGDRDAVAVIAYSFWRDLLGADPAAIGKTIRIGNGQFTVVGVAPETFHGIVMDWGEPPVLWTPVQHYKEAAPVFPLDIIHSSGMESYLMTGRLRPGVTTAQASAELAALTSRLREAQNRRRNQHAILLPIQQARFWPSYRGSIVTFLGALMTIVGVILLIACCNLANLLLARAANRRREIAMRLALGAGRARLARQLLTESLLLSLLGGAGALVVASESTRFLTQFRRAFRIQLTIDTAWDARVILFAIGLSLLTGLLFGSAPVLQSWRADLAHALKAGAAASGHARSRMRSGLLIGQVALSTLLLAGAGLFVQTLHNARAEGPLQGASQMLVAGLQPQINNYDAPRGQRFYKDVLQRVRAIPGVRSASLVLLVPFSGTRGGTDIIAPDGMKHQVDFNIISSGYFGAAGLPLLHGREFQDTDDAGAPDVGIVNELFASRFWPGEDPIGKQIQQVRLSRVWTVVGVVRDGKARGYRDTIRPAFYVPIGQEYRGGMTLEARTLGDAAPFTAALRHEIQAVDTSIPLAGVRTMESLLDDALSQERLIASFASGLGLLALILAAVGIYGVLSFNVSRRAREIGIRMALGARPLDVSRLVVRESAVLAGAGLAIGAVGAWLLARLAKALLYGVTTSDPGAFGFAAVLLALVAVAAALVPAYRAARLDPASTLRAE